MPESLQTLDGVTEWPNKKNPDSDNSFIAHARIHELKTGVDKKGFIEFIFISFC